ncbi:MAG: VCBS repeat-containing protein [Chloroflexi bacterium]|nr:VCBS repeat-containing protein [Chloroflexota bacterium]
MPVKWKQHLIAYERYETAGVFDVRGDGRPNIVSGAYWYETADIRTQHPIGEIQAVGEYYDDFSTLPMDINGNGRLDFVTGGWWGDTLRWRENPGDSDSEWPEHVIAETGNVETTRAWDVDGDGQLEVVPNTPGGPLVVYKLKTDAGGRGAGVFDTHTVFNRAQGHGLGFGDINGNGRGDFVLCNGWLQAPEHPFEQEWIYHAEFDFGMASIPILVVDVNGDGLSDLIVGQAHGYGLDWWEQRISTQGERSWLKHPIDPDNAQYHDLHWVDIDNDGEMELVTGKRYRAHCGNDTGAYDDVGIYYFKWNGESFSKQIISYGPPGIGKGCGILFAIADITGNGCLDIVAPGKDGLVLFENLGS